MKIILVIIILLLIPIGVNAQSEDIKIIEGKYVNKDIGVEFVIPENWSGAQLQSISTSTLSIDAILASPGDIRTSQEAVFILIVIASDKEGLKKQDFPDPIDKMKEQNCELLSARFMTIGSIEGIEVITECSEIDNGNTVIVRNKAILAKESTKIISILFISEADTYDKYIQDFDGMLDTLRVADSFIAFPDLPNQITEKFDQVSVEIKTNSEISELKFNEEDKSISFDVSKEDKIGISEIYLSSILKEPYTIIINETAFLRTDIEKGVKIVYKDDVNEIKIIGTEVVPEFPIVLPILALVTSMIIFISKRIN